MGLRVLCVLGLGLLAATWALDCSDPTGAFCEGGQRQRTVVVLGGGLAGLAATVEAHRAGANVVLVEKEPRVGGNSAKATSGINGAVTRFQEQRGVTDSTEAFTKDTLVSGHGLCKGELVDVLVGRSREALDWVAAMGLDLANLVQLGGHSAKRTHREPARADGKPSPVGFNIVSAVRKHAEALQAERLSILTGTRALRLVQAGTGSSGRVVGVDVLGPDQAVKRLDADAVVLATGGFGNDHTETSLLAEFAPQLAGLPTTNGAFAQGDGVKMARQLGAQLIHMDQVQVHPTGFVDPADPTSKVKFLGPEALRGAGGVLLNAQGRRFYNELGRRDDVSAAIFAENVTLSGVDGSPLVAYLVMNDEASLLFGLPNLGFYKGKGLIRPTTVASLATEIGADPKVLAATLDEYGRGADPFGKAVFPVLFNSSEALWVSTITPAIHYTMGGAEINAHGQMLRPNAEPIPGLYGAGEVTGGVHGGNRLGGNSLLECVVFGRIAGHNAATGSQAAP